MTHHYESTGAETIQLQTLDAFVTRHMRCGVSLGLMRRLCFPGKHASSKGVLSRLTAAGHVFMYAGGTMKQFRGIILGVLLISAMPLLGQTKSVSPQPHSQAQSKGVSAAHPDRGQQVFEQNCSRCHDAPTGFSPRISGTIAMHMRVRAGLSEEDYKELRRFLNP